MRCRPSSCEAPLSGKSCDPPGGRAHRGRPRGRRSGRRIEATPRIKEESPSTRVLILLGIASAEIVLR
jgi:hypothetical protein